jgi:biopolymer transport protein TolQ
VPASSELSIISLIIHATLPVQAVMLTLFLASFFSWVFIIQRGRALGRARKEMAAFEEQFWSGIDLGKLYRDGNARANDGQLFTGLELLFRAGFKEFFRLRQQEGADPEAVLDGVQRAMRVSLSKEQEKLEAQLPFLATVGSTSPYVGLLGTVWGIMNSFRGLSTVQQATLATVAPGIAEALVATAIGLFAAIPAVVAYNRYSAMAEGLMANYQTFTEEFSNILHRQLHSRGPNRLGE